MNTASGTRGRRTIKVKDFLDDYRSAIGDLELMQKYDLSVRGLDKFVQLLVDRKILSVDEVALRNEKIAYVEPERPATDSDHSAFMCPSCLITWPEMFDICPNCGVLVQEYMSRHTSHLDSQPVGTEPPEPIDREGDPESQVPTINRMSEVNVSSNCSDESTPIEIPLFENMSVSAPEKRRPVASVRDESERPFVWAENVRVPTASADAPGEDIIPGTPIDNHDNQIHRPYYKDAWCTSCATPMEPDLRQVYDERPGRSSLKLAGICLLLGFVGAFSLTLFDGYSFARLLVVYGTGMLLMAAGVFMTVGVLMLMAKERVFRCPNCDRVCPRA